MSSAREQQPSQQDILDELRTLDEACGDNDRYFRHRVRQVLERRRWDGVRRVQAEGAESKF